MHLIIMKSRSYEMIHNEMYVLHRKTKQRFGLEICCNLLNFTLLGFIINLIYDIWRRVVSDEKV